MPELLDSFDLNGPNGVHQCLVMESLGPSMASLAESHEANRLLGVAAWEVSKQVVRAIAFVHRMGIVHGDLHPGNIVLVDPTISKKSADDILRSMDPPMTSEIRGGSHFPQYLVLPSTLLFSPILSDNCKVKLIDFGSAFLSGGPSPKMRRPLPFRAPEAVMTGSWDVEADIWSLGCTIFALIVGYPAIRLFPAQRERTC